ncbi:MAG: hypothetical protein ACX98W_09695 [bacterium]
MAGRNGARPDDSREHREHREQMKEIRGRGGARGLASARDRRRLLERRAAERMRVERMLAAAPMPVDREEAPGPRRRRPDGQRPKGRGPSGRGPTGRGPADRGGAGQGPAPRGRDRARLERPGRTAARCRVCDGVDVVCDEVAHAGWLRLAHCRRCDHRWTERPAARVTPRVDRELCLDLPF